MAAPRHRHSDNAYKNGNTDCAGCRAAHTKAQAAYRAGQKKEAVGPAAPLMLLSEILRDAGGPLESALDAELEFLEADPPFRRTMVELARMDARLLDHADSLKITEIATLQNRLLRILGELGKEETHASADEIDLAELLKPE